MPNLTETDHVNIDELYRDLATAKGEASQARFFRTKWQAALKDNTKLKDELIAALRRANAAELAVKELLAESAAPDSKTAAE